MHAGAIALGLSLAPPAVARAEALSVACGRPPTEIYGDLGPRVVQILSIGIDPFRVAGRVLPGSGSGILLSENRVLTNCDVVQGGRLIPDMLGGMFVGPTGGFLVETVEPGSAADKAGIRGGVFPVTWGGTEIVLGGDVILEVEGRPLEPLDEALEAVDGLEIGQTVDLVIRRDGEILEVTARIEDRPPQESDLWVKPAE